jgi:acyl carrier protein
MEPILHRVQSVLVDQLGVSPEEVTLETTFSDLGADSLDQIEIVMALEEEFGIDIEDEEAEFLLTVGQAVELLEKKVNG